ncbi:MAG: WXG100 family type VII secretion target [Clostridia bacterium]|nr:WXG100 family type VII secretion target [Clostridia bacterium]
MEIKVEIQELALIAGRMKESSDAIAELLRYLNPDSDEMAFWIGDGKDAYMDVVKNFRGKVEEYSVVLNNTTAALMESLNKYVDIESENIRNVTQLPSDDIF